MSEIYIPRDPRDALERMNRRELWLCARANGIEFKEGEKATHMRDLLRAHNADLQKGIEWHDITLQLEDGKTTTEPHPKRKIPASMDPAYQEKRAAEFARRTAVEEEEKKKQVEEKLEEIRELRQQVKELATQNEQLMDYVKRSLEKDNRKKTVKETDPYKMKYLAQKKWLKEHGIELNKGDNVKALIRKVLNQESQTSE